MNRNRFAIYVAQFFVALAVCRSPAVAAGPQVTIVVGQKAEEIERFAADEMAGQLKKLFDAQVTIAPAANADAANVIYLGTKASCPLAAKLGDAWPKLAPFDQALHTCRDENRTVLLVTGDKPNDVLRAAYELGRHYGIRYFTFGDLYPVSPPAFTVDGFDRIVHGREREIVWKSTPWFGIGSESWGADEHRQFILQLLKMGFRKSEGIHSVVTIKDVFRVRVDGDTAGRAAFRGAQYFDIPELTSKDNSTTREQLLEKRVSKIYEDLMRFDPKEMILIGGGIQSSIIENNRIEVRSHSSILPRALHNHLYNTLQKTKLRLPIELIITNPGDHAFSLAMIGYEVRDMQKNTGDLFNDILNPVCGEGVGTAVRLAFNEIDQIAFSTENDLPEFGVPNPKMLTRYYESAEPPPAWWGEVRTHYLNAMNEMYRANTRAREGGRAFTLYYARRFEFGFEYMNAVEALRKAAIAKKAGNKDEQIAELEKALDSITACCNAMAAVARSNSDRGIIAVMNEYGYRPVTKLLEEADAGR